MGGAQGAGGESAFVAIPNQTRLSYSLPGGYALVSRLDLTDEQKKLLGEIATEHGKERYAKTQAIYAKLPKLARSSPTAPFRWVRWSR